MADVSSWADEWRAEHRETGTWHYVNIPADAEGYDADRDCQRRACVVAKISGYARMLGNPARSDEARERALKFVIHFVGDVHQPLHAADRHDRGGNDLHVIYAGRPANLHHLWDVELLAAAQGSDSEMAFVQRLDQPNGAAAEGDPVAWANEAHALAVSVAYGALPAYVESDLTGDYAAQAVPVIDGQLERAGLRLAALLNATLQ